MHNRIRNIFGGMLMVTVFLLSVPIRVLAGQAVYTNPDTDYCVILEDDAGILTETDEASLEEIMREISVYGNVGLKTISRNDTTAEKYLEEYYRQKFGRDSGIIFLIDMDNRKIWLRSDGNIQRTIKGAELDTIADNCYRFASRGDYFSCAEEAFSEIKALLEGRRIARPMKYVSNALLAVILAMLMNYCILKWGDRKEIPDRKKLLSKTKYHIRVVNPRAEFVRTTKRYVPKSSGGSDSSGGGSSGGGGGGSSGSSGGHSF